MDPSRIIAQADRLRNQSAQPKRNNPKRKQKPHGSPVETPAAKEAKPTSSFRIRNGDLDDLRSKADRRLAQSGARKKQAKQKLPPPPERKCRECLQVKPSKAFPSRAAVCGACGGQPRSTSVHTISGGLPTGGRRR